MSLARWGLPHLTSSSSLFASCLFIGGYFLSDNTRATVGMMISQCPTFNLWGCPHRGNARYVFCCFIYQAREFVSATIDYQPTCLFITWGRTLVQPSPLGQAEPLSSHAATVRGTCYRVGYGGHNGAIKKPLTTAP